MRFRLGADGSNGEIDCIHMVYAVLADLGIAAPPFQEGWYQASWPVVARAFLQWGRRIAAPRLDGDVLLMPGDKAFAVAWQNGVLHIDRLGNQVCWAPLSILPSCPCCRSRDSSAS